LIGLLATVGVVVYLTVRARKALRMEDS